MELYKAHTGKVSDKWEHYLHDYDSLFSCYRDQPISMLEIGVQNGGSLEIWSKYFSNAVNFVGCDVNPKCAHLVYDDPRISVIVGDANDYITKQKIHKKCASFDIIIDDGSHRSADIVNSFVHFFPMLRNHGVFVVEDLHCSYWEEYDGGLFHPYSSMSFFKLLTDIVNQEHWGLSKTAKQFLKGFEEKYKIEFIDDVLRQIHSIEFTNSICIIRKSRLDKNILGDRCVAGQDDSISSGNLLYPCKTETAPNQAANFWSSLSERPAEKYKSLQQDLSDLRTRISELNQYIDERDQKITGLMAEVQRLALRCDALEHSSSWLITRPLRVAAALARGNPAYLAQLHKVPVMQTFAVPFKWVGASVIRVRRMANLVRRLSGQAGGIGPLIGRAVHVLRQQGVSGLRAKLHQLQAGNASSLMLRHEELEEIARNIFIRQQSELSEESARHSQDSFAAKPLISVIMPVYNTPIRWLRRAVESLQEQYYENWELCAVDDCSPSDAQRTLLQEIAASDVRVRFMAMGSNGGISSASNAALKMARGEYIALLDHDDELTPDALYRVVEAINRQPDADYIYSDECKVTDGDSRRLFHFVFKPDWSPELMFNGMLTGHLTVYRKHLVENIGGFRSRYDFSQDYDLALRAGEVAKHIMHIERLLYLWRSVPGSAAAGGKAFARNTNIGALDEALQRRNIPGEAIAAAQANCVRIALPAKSPLVSIVIPSDSAENLRLVVGAIREGTDYSNFEIVVVCNGPLADVLMVEFYGWSPLRFVKYDRKYNFSDKCNEGAAAAHGEIVVFYNDDVFPMQRDWIERLIEYLWVPGVGGVSPKLVHADDTIQYAGMISGTPGLCGTAYNNVPMDAPDPFLAMHKYVRNVSILSGACCALRKDVFLEVGGFDAAHTPDGHSDMDLSYKLIEKDYRCVYTPHALLRHIGNHSWGTKPSKYKADIYALKRWGRMLSKDPYFTDSMKEVLYRDFPFFFKIYADHINPHERYTGPDVLFVSHELTLSGAPRMLFYAARILRRNGGFPVVVAPADGPMREEFIDAGITVIIDASLHENHFLFERFARNFDLVVVNTVALSDVVRQLSTIPILRILWWLHEAQSLSYQLKHLAGVSWERVCTLCVSEYAKTFVPPGIAVKVLPNGIPDRSASPGVRVATAPVTFLLAGTIEPRKGQDIFVEAVARMPPEVRRECRFLMTGKLWDGNREFWQKVEEKIEQFQEIRYLGLVDHAECLKLVAESDIVVCCSRDEPASLIVSEAAMLGKPTIISKRVGQIDLLEPNSYLSFAPESVCGLSEQMCNAYEMRETLPAMGKLARQRFETSMTLSMFEERFMKLVAEQIDPSSTVEPGTIR